MQVLKLIECTRISRLPLLFCRLMVLSVIPLVGLQSPVLAKTSPTLRLFPTTVVESIKHTSETAKAMEADLQSVIERLNQQEELYTASKCEGAEAEQGCSEITGQLSQTYLEMLNLMESRLPGMEDSVRATNTSLERRIRKELGRKTTPRGLQKLLEKTPLKPSEPVSYRRRSGKLSEKFRQYYRLVATTSRTGSGGSLAAVAAEIYLDTQEVQDLIALTRDEISSAKLMIDLDQIYGIITTKMFVMVGRVKTIIFGETGEEEGIPDPPQGNLKAEYESPLDM
ncbi:MAG: hypothetical protein DRH90_24125 [Deltaproteobacteria bacterium]|nr:MAG: hypothetical protein DRH90_24125 [Deltaproteobacteria bacterium]